MARNDPQVNVKMKKELKDWLRKQAIANRRSLNSELIVCLEQVQSQRQQKQETANAQPA